MKRTIWVAFGICSLLMGLAAQQADLTVKLMKGDLPAIALPDYKGAGRAAPLMEVFNGTVFSEVESSGLFKMVSKSMMPVKTPQQLSDFQQPAAQPQQPARRGRREPPPPVSGEGLWLQDWAGPPANANYLAIGYAAEQNGVLVFYGWLLNVNRENPSAAQIFGKRYFGPVDENGARKEIGRASCRERV